MSFAPTCVQHGLYITRTQSDMHASIGPVKMDDLTSTGLGDGQLAEKSSTMLLEARSPNHQVRVITLCHLLDPCRKSNVCFLARLLIQLPMWCDSLRHWTRSTTFRQSCKSDPFACHIQRDWVQGIASSQCEKPQELDSKKACEAARRSTWSQGKLSLALARTCPLCKICSTQRSHGTLR